MSENGEFSSLMGIEMNWSFNLFVLYRKLLSVWFYQKERASVCEKGTIEEIFSICEEDPLWEVMLRSLQNSGTGDGPVCYHPSTVLLEGEYLSSKSAAAEHIWGSRKY